jgi:hypothetical protein
MTLTNGTEKGDDTVKTITGGMKPASDWGNLQLFLEGPFALVEQKNYIDILAIQPGQMHFPPGFTASLNEAAFCPGDYKLSLKRHSRVPRSRIMKTGAAKSPVILDTYKGEVDPDPKLVYLKLEVPIPNEIWPLLPDQAKIAETGAGLRSAPLHWYGTRLVLTYAGVDLSAIQFTGTPKNPACPKEIVHKPKFPCPAEVTELNGVGVLTFDMQRRDTSADPYDHAKMAFKMRSEMLGIERSIDYPAPLIRRERGIHNDCRATGLLIVEPGSLASLQRVRGQIQEPRSRRITGGRTTVRREIVFEKGRPCTKRCRRRWSYRPRCPDMIVIRNVARSQAR